MNSSKRRFLYLSKLSEQNGKEYEDAGEEVEYSRKGKGKKTKESMQSKQKKRKVEETEKDGNDKKDLSNNETMAFIDMLEENQCLWDLFRQDYSKSAVNTIVYSSLAAAFETNVSSTNTKIMNCELR